MGPGGALAHPAATPSRTRRAPVAEAAARAARGRRGRTTAAAGRRGTARRCRAAVSRRRSSAAAGRAVSAARHRTRVRCARRRSLADRGTSARTGCPTPARSALQVVRIAGVEPVTLAGRRPRWPATRGGGPRWQRRDAPTARRPKSPGCQRAPRASLEVLRERRARRACCCTFSQLQDELSRSARGICRILFAARWL